MDPIQFHLMLYACAAAALKPGPGLAPRRPPTHVYHPLGNPIPTLTGWAAEYGPGQAIGAALGYLGQEIGFPIGAVSSYQAVVCGSILLYSYNVQVTAQPNEVWQQSSPPAGPYQSQITATVSFSFQQDLDSLPSQIAAWAGGCDFPQNGPQNNLSVEWELTDELPQHGSLVQSDTVTWLGGQARATYQTIQEPVPPVFQAMSASQLTSGLVYLRVLNVVPQWPKFEAVARLANPNAAAGDTLLLVHYYKWPQLTLNFDSDLKWYPTCREAHVMATGVQLKLIQGGSSTAPTYTYQGQQNEAYASFTWDPSMTVVSYAGGQFQAAIPVQPSLTAANLVVMVNIGTPEETVYVDGVGDATTYCFAGWWSMAHTQDYVTASPYAGWYAIGGWQGSGSSLNWTYNGPRSDDITENTTLTLAGTPGP
jgi:hypothetical protein